MNELQLTLSDFKQYLLTLRENKTTVSILDNTDKLIEHAEIIGLVNPTHDEKEFQGIVLLDHTTKVTMIISDLTFIKKIDFKEEEGMGTLRSIVLIDQIEEKAPSPIVIEVSEGLDGDELPKVISAA